jgi:hypothetical protein
MSKPNKSHRSEKQVATNQRDGWRYIRGGTVPRTIPAGKILVHNRVIHGSDWHCGANGFRCWTLNKSSSRRWRVCPCGWSGLKHYASPEHVKYQRSARARREMALANKYGCVWYDHNPRARKRRAKLLGRVS